MTPLWITVMHVQSIEEIELSVDVYDDIVSQMYQVRVANEVFHNLEVVGGME